MAFRAKSTLMYEAISKAGYDAIAPGNHDDAYGDAHLVYCASLAPETAMLAINLTDAQGKLPCGIALIVIGSALFAAMHAGVRFVSAGVHPFEIAFFRNLFGFLVFTPMLVRSGPMMLYTRRLGAHLGRGAINSFSMLAWFTALSLIPLAEATALALTGPLFVTMGAIFFLGETVRARRWIALGVGAAGTMVILRPGFADVSFGAALFPMVQAWAPSPTRS